MRILVLFILVGITMTLNVNSQPTPKSDWDSFVREFIESYFKHHPDFAVYQGRHEFDGKFPDWTPEGLKKQAMWLKDQKKAALAFAGLNEQQSFERDYLVSVTDKDLFWLETAELPYVNPTFYNLDPNVYVTRPYASLEVRLKSYVAYATGIPAATEQIKKNLRTPLPKTFVDIGRISFGGWPRIFRTMCPAFSRA